MAAAPSDWKIDRATGRLIAPNRDIAGLRSVSFFELKEHAGGGNIAIDWNAGLKHRVTMTGNVTLSFVAPQGPTNGVLFLVQDPVGDHAPAWPGNVRAGDGQVRISRAPGSITVLGVAFDGTDFHLSSTPNSSGPITTTLV